MKKYFSAAFWDYASERALKTVAQALIVGGLIGEQLLNLNWPEIASLSGGMALASILTSVLLYKGDGTDDPNDLSVGKHAA